MATLHATRCTQLRRSRVNVDDQCIYVYLTRGRCDTWLSLGISQYLELRGDTKGLRVV